MDELIMDEHFPVCSIDAASGIDHGGVPEPTWFARARKARGRDILLVIPGRLFRESIEGALRSSGLAFVGGCDTLAEAGTLLRTRARPDLILVGSTAPDDLYEQLGRIRALRAQLPGTRWALLSRAPEARLLGEAIDAGVDGVLLHDISPEALHHAIELILLGHSLVPAEFVKQMAPRRSGAEAPPAPGAESDGGEPDGAGAAGGTGDAPRPAPTLKQQGNRTLNLSEREGQILQCLVKGLSNKVIARDLKIAEATVKVHIKGLLRKMQVKNRTQAAIWALNNPLPGARNGGNVVDLPTAAGRGGPNTGPPEHAIRLAAL